MTRSRLWFLCAIFMLAVSCASTSGSLNSPFGAPSDEDAPQIEEASAESLFPGDPVLTIRFVNQVSPASTLLSTTDCRLEQETSALELGERARQEALSDGLRLVEVTGMEGIQAEQETTKWCWAACVQAVLRHSRAVPEGTPLEQAEIARHFHGDDRISGADQAILVRALAPEVELEITENGLDCGADLRVLGVDPLIEALAQGELVVAGLRSPSGEAGHIVLITGAVFGEVVRREWEEKTQDHVLDFFERQVSAKLESGVRRVRRELDDMMEQRCSRYALEELRISDPTPGVGSTRMSGEEFRTTCDFFLTQSMAREILSTEFNSLRLFEELDEALSEGSEVN
jgi:hypothetical protein